MPDAGELTRTLEYGRAPRRRNVFSRYAHWLHLQWPAGLVEKLPVADGQGRSNVEGLYIVGDLTGVPLLKLSANAGYDATARIADDLAGTTQQDDVLDLAIIGGGTAGFSAAKEAERRDLRYCVFEANTPFNTIKDFPKGKPIYTYPSNVDVKGELRLNEKSEVKEGLVEDLEEQTVNQGLKWVRAQVENIERSNGLLAVVLAEPAEAPAGLDLDGTDFVTRGTRIRAKRVIVAIGRSGSYRTLDVPGEVKTEKVTHRLHDPADYAGQKVLVVGGGDSAIEAAIALAQKDARVTLSYRKPEFNRPKPENQERIEQFVADGSLDLLLPSTVKAIHDEAVDLDVGGQTKTIENDQVFLMIGRDAPLDFFRHSGVRIRNEKTTWWWVSLIGFVLFCTWLYHWKSTSSIPYGLADSFSWLMLPAETIGRWIEAGAQNPETVLGTLGISMTSRGFYYTLAYSLIVVIFGWRRIRRRKTPYVTVQTTTLAFFQVVPLFLLPELILPLMQHNGAFDSGMLRTIADGLFPAVDYGHGREFWRAYGLILAWPLAVFNWFTNEPLMWWLILGGIQTFVFIPAIVYLWGKGAYCGWICSCGALAETLGDQHREKMPHGPWANRLNLVGQVILGLAFVLLGIRIVGWIWPQSWADATFQWLYKGGGVISYNWFIDLFLAGIVGYGLYFWFSGRVWCRFFCPLAALMHIYHRFGRFAILAEKKKCISCNVCTSVCHQGIDVMSFANKGLPMVDPQCVRCSACVQECPTGVLEFGMIDRGGSPSSSDPKWLAASPVRIREHSLGDGVKHGGSSNTAPAPVLSRVKLTINGKRTRRSGSWWRLNPLA